MTSDPGFLAFRDVLYDSLAGAAPAVGDSSPMDVLRRVSVAAFRAAPEIQPALRPLNDIAAAATLELAVQAAQAHYSDATAFSEAIYFARCLGRDAGQTLRLLAGRVYLLEAFLPEEAYEELATDRLTILELANFHRGWLDPMRLEGSLNLIRLWRQEYVSLYEAAHDAYHREIAAIFEQMEDLRVPAIALQRLNGLRRLGPAVALHALERQQFLDRLFPCPSTVSMLAGSLATSPFCPECGFRLGSDAPVEDARQVVTAVNRGLGNQQARLARRVIGRLLSRPAVESEAKLQRFIEVVQASDLHGLAAVLDDEVIAFLDDLLSEGEAAGVLSRLARAFPAVDAGNLDAAVEEFRRLLTDETAREGIVRLRSPAESRPSRRTEQP